MAVRTLPVPRALLATLVVTLGVAGFLAIRSRAPRLVVAPGAPGTTPATWVAKADGGGPLEVAVPSRGLVLNLGESFWLEAEGPELRYERLVFRLERNDLISMLTVDFRATQNRSYKLQLLPSESLSAFLTWRPPGGWDTLLAEVNAAEFEAGSQLPFEIAITLREGRILVTLDGHVIMDVEDEHPAAGSVVVRGDGIRLLSVITEGTRLSASEPDEPFTTQEGFWFLRHAGTAEDPFESIALLLLTVLLLAAYLRARCHTRPPLEDLLYATLTVLVAASLPLALGLVGGFSGATLGLASCALAVLSLPLALSRLAPSPEATLATGPYETIRSWVVIGLLTAWCADAAVTAREAADARVQPIARAHLAKDPVRIPQERSLDLSNALTLPGPYRSFDLRASLNLAPHSLLELRLRGTPRHARGLALCLSTETRFQTSFYIEQELEFRPLGEGSTHCEPDVDHELHLRIRGPRFEAFLDGQRVALAEDRTFASGPVEFLAAKGHVSIQDLRLQPTPYEPEGPDPLLGVLWTAGMPLFVIVGLGLAASWLLGAPRRKTLECLAFAMLPWGLGFRSAEAVGLLSTDAFAWSSALAALLLLAGPTHPGTATAGPRSTRPLRAGLVGLLCLAAGPGAMYAALGPPDPGEARVIQPYRGARDLIPGLHYFQLPSVRQVNTYLKSHRFRNRRFSLEKPEGTRRVIAVGSSSTWGFAIPEARRATYPAILQQLLNDTPTEHPFEVINGAISGTTSARMLAFFEDVLLEFDPDIVTISFYFNDSIRLTQFDEARFSDQLRGADFLGGPLQQFLWARELAAGKHKRERLFDAYPAAGGETLPIWRSIEGDTQAATPPERFESILRRYTDRLAQRDIALVFIKEPIMWGVKDLWRREFYEVIDRLGAELGVPVLDLDPALQAAGGDKLFMDPVHPLPAGNRVIAETLLPVILDLDRRLP